MSHERLNLSFSVVATSVVATAALLVAGVAYAAPVETIDKFFLPQGKKVTEATYPSAESARQYLQEQSAVGVSTRR